MATIDKERGSARKRLRVGIYGSVITAACCFTPILVVGLGFLGLAALTPYLDYALLPALAFFLLLTLTALWKKKRQL